jgi:hypothetical protein
MVTESNQIYKNENIELNKKLNCKTTEQNNAFFPKQRIFRKMVFQLLRLSVGRWHIIDRKAISFSRLVRGNTAVPRFL